MTTALTPTDDLIDRFLARVEKETPTRPRLIIAIDATASRQATWDAACSVQAGMFKEAARHGGVEVSLAYYRGDGEMKATSWYSSAKPLVGAMTAIHCRAGITQIGRVLRHAVDEVGKGPIAGLVLIGDVCEEPLDLIQPSAAELGRLRVPAYCFLEGEDPSGRQAFAMIAAATGGALLPFDSRSPDRLGELLSAIAALVTGGVEALADHRPEIAGLLTGRGQ